MVIYPTVYPQPVEHDLHVSIGNRLCVIRSDCFRSAKGKHLRAKFAALIPAD